MGDSKGIFPTAIITMDEKSNDAGSQNRTVKNYATRVFQESTVGMVASIASTHSNARRCFKSLLLTLCVTGFLYQCTTFLLHVFDYPTVVDVKIETPKVVTMPAYTFCNNNGIKRSVFCGLYPERCYKPSKKFCSNFFSYCGKNETLIPKKDFYEVEDTMSHDEIVEYGDTLDEFLIYQESKIEDNVTVTGPYLRVKNLNTMTNAMICYSLHSVAHSSELPQTILRKTSEFAMTPVDKLVFYVEENEMFIPGNRPGVLFKIHSPYDSVNPFIKGIFMKPGRTYKIFVNMVQEVLLEDPFLTNCLDYEEIWEANNRTGPRIQEMCQHKCLLDFSMACFGCVPPIVLYPSEERICDRDDMNTFINCPDEEFILECWNQCRDDCKVTKYTPEIMERYEVDYDEAVGDLTEFHRQITVEIYLEDNEIMTLKHSPKYMSVEVFSAIGGFIGCWLGISLMDIIDVFASVFTVAKYAWTKSGRKLGFKFQRN